MRMCGPRATNTTAEQMKKQFITNLCQWDAYGRGFSKSIVVI